MAKYTHVRLDLEAARSWLDDSDEVDKCLASVIDHVIETVLRIENMRAREHSNILPFRLKAFGGQGRFTKR